MSLRKLVVEMIVVRGCGTVDHLMPELKELGYKRCQVLKALQNAQYLGFLWCEPAGKAGVPTASNRPGVYWPGSKKVDPNYSNLVARKTEPTPMVSSVFELGEPRPLNVWPKKPGTVYRLLGEWDSDDSRKAA